MLAALAVTYPGTRAGLGLVSVTVGAAVGAATIVEVPGVPPELLMAVVPAKLVTVTLTVTVPLAPAVKAVELVVLLPVRVPVAIDQV